MLYTTYYAERTNITKERFQEMKRNLLEAGKQAEVYKLRKLEFTGTVSMQPMARYYLCMKQKEDTVFFLEKKYIQNGLHYKKCVTLSEDECKRIVAGDLEWMKNHKKELLADFYRQATLNSLYPGRITDYRRESWCGKKGEYLIFNTEISRGVGPCRDFMKAPSMTISCLDEDKVLMNYKKKANLPQIVSSMLQIQEEGTEDMEFAF